MLRRHTPESCHVTLRRQPPPAIRHAHYSHVTLYAIFFSLLRHYATTLRQCYTSHTGYYCDNKRHAITVTYAYLPTAHAAHEGTCRHYCAGMGWGSRSLLPPPYVCSPHAATNCRHCFTRCLPRHQRLRRLFAVGRVHHCRQGDVRQLSHNAIATPLIICRLLPPRRCFKMFTVITRYHVRPALSATQPRWGQPVRCL